MDPRDLLPKLPDPSELRPFPRQFSFAFLGHTTRINSFSIERSGQLLASASESGEVFIWDILAGCCLKVRLELYFLVKEEYMYVYVEEVCSLSLSFPRVCLVNISWTENLPEQESITGSLEPGNATTGNRS